MTLHPAYDPETPRIGVGWVALFARIHAVDHATLDLNTVGRWVCGCDSCNVARQTVALLAARRAERGGLVDVVAADIAAVGGDLVTE